MKFRIDIPNNYLSPRYFDHQEVRKTYSLVTEYLLAQDYQLELRKARPFSVRAQERAGPDTVHYAYHCRSPHSNMYCLKPGPLPDLWYFDSSGYSGWCELTGNSILQEKSAAFDIDRANELLSSYRHAFRDSQLSRLPQAKHGLEGAIAELEGFIFYPLQVNSDEVLKLARFGQSEVLRRLRRLSADFGTPIVLKRHPLCESHFIRTLLAELSQEPGIFVTDGSIHELIDRCRAVLVSNSGVGFQALIHGKRVYSLADSEYGHLTKRIESLEDLSQVFEDKREEQSPIIRSQLAFILDEYFVDVTREEKVHRRVEAHIAAFEGSSEESTAGTPDLRHVSSLYRVEKETHEIIEFLLAAYRSVEGETRERLFGPLSFAAGLGLRRDQIFRGTDSFLWSKAIPRYLAREDYALAEVLAQRLVKGNPSAARFQFVHSKVLYAKGKEGAALSAARRAVQCEDVDAEMLAFLARKLMRKDGDVKGEIAGYVDHALALDSNMAVVHWLKAWLEFDAGNIPASWKSIQTAHRLDPDDSKVMAFRRRVCLRLVAGHLADSKNELAMDLVESALGLVASEADYHLFIAQAHLEVEQSADAVSRARKAIDCDPSCVEALIFLGRRLLVEDSPDLDEIESMATRALELNADEGLAYFLLAQVRYLHGELAEADRQMRYATRLSANNRAVSKFAAKIDVELKAANQHGVA